jgi:hypothetical protein
MCFRGQKDGCLERILRPIASQDVGVVAVVPIINLQVVTEYLSTAHVVSSELRKCQEDLLRLHGWYWQKV